MSRVFDAIAWLLRIVDWFESPDERHLLRDVVIRAAVVSFGLVIVFSAQDVWSDREMLGEPDQAGVVTRVDRAPTGTSECAYEIYSVERPDGTDLGTLDDCDFSHDVSERVTVRVSEDGDLAEDVTDLTDYVAVVPAVTLVLTAGLTAIVFIVFGIRLGLVRLFSGPSIGRHKRD